MFSGSHSRVTIDIRKRSSQQSQKTRSSPKQVLWMVPEVGSPALRESAEWELLSPWGLWKQRVATVLRKVCHPEWHHTLGTG